MKILLHICCAPCMIHPLRILREEGNDVTGIYYNPNIHPYLEYQKRFEAVKTYADGKRLLIIRENSYPVEEFVRQIAFREDQRCRYCYHLRLTRAAQTAKRGGFEAFTSTLLYSRFQKHDLIRYTGESVAEAQGIPFLYRDFRIGWSEGVRISKEMGIYRQQYCGCIYSEKERYCHVPPREVR